LMAYELYGPELTTQDFVNAVVGVGGVLVEYVTIEHVEVERWQVHGVEGQTVSPKSYRVTVHLLRPKPRNTFTLEFKGDNLRALVCQFEERLAEMRKTRVL